MSLDLASAFVALALAGDRDGALARCSPAFGVHDGRDAGAWVDHEISEYAARGERFGLRDGFRLAASVGLPGRSCFALINADGAFVSEESMLFDGAGLALGNGRTFEIVSKLSFGGPVVRRGLAVRPMAGTTLELVRPAETVGEGLALAPAANFDGDGFHTCTFSLPGDDLLGKGLRLLLRGRRGGEMFRESCVVWMRGVDSPFYVADQYPVIDGARVATPSGAGRHWSLSVTLDDGTSAIVEHPGGGESFRFPRPVTTAILTDAMDNDWTSSRGVVHG